MMTMATRLGTAVADISQMRGAFVLVLVDADADAYLVSRGNSLPSSVAESDMPSSFTTSTIRTTRAKVVYWRRLT